MNVMDSERKDFSLSLFNSHFFSCWILWHFWLLLLLNSFRIKLNFIYFLNLIYSTGQYGLARQYSIFVYAFFLQLKMITTYFTSVVYFPLLAKVVGKVVKLVCQPPISLWKTSMNARTFYQDIRLSYTAMTARYVIQFYFYFI